MIATDIHAATIAFYADRLAVVAHGHVRTRLADGLDVEANSLLIDLRGNVYVFAGDVRAHRGAETLDAAAMRVNLDDERGWALAERDGTPATVGFSPKHPAQTVAEAAPDTAFSFPELGEFRPYIHGPHATIVPKTNIRFTPALFSTSVGVTVPSPSYLFTYAPNPNLGANALPGASFDQPYGLFGTRNTLLAAHFRYDSSVGASLGLDEHIVYGDKAYVAIGVAPLKPKSAATQANIYQKIDNRRSQTLNLYSGPYVQSGQYQFTQAIHAATVTATLYQSSINGSGNLQWLADPRPLPLRLNYQLRAGFGYERNIYGILQRNDVDPINYTFQYRHYLGAFVATPLYRVPFGTSLLLSADGQRTWYAYPHQRDGATLNATLSRPLVRKINQVGTITYAYNADTYPGSQLRFYPPPALKPVYTAINGLPWPGYAAYSGATSGHLYSLDTFWTPSAAFNARLTLIATRDFPQFGGNGRPPYTATGNIRWQPGSTLAITLGRSYYFNWGNQTWSPQWSLSVSSP